MTQLLHEKFELAAKRYPLNTALVTETERLTYADLHTAVNRLARLLREVGCQDGDRIAILAPKSAEAIIAMLAALNARCLYVPVDTQNPVDRAVRIVDACRPRVILATAAAAPLLDAVVAASPVAQAATLGWLGGEVPKGPTFSFGPSDVASQSDAPLRLPGDPERRAHILFTSGSTGQPKGVVIQHASVCTFVDWAVDYFGIAAGDRLSGHAPLHFDLSTFDIFGALTTGAELHPVPQSLIVLPANLAGFIREHELTQWFSVPSVLNYMARLGAVREYDFPLLKRVMWCGEALPTPSLIHWMQRLPHVKFTNLYGPTEATIASSYHTVPVCPDDPAAPIPIGVPCRGERLYVLDDNGLPAAPGEIGHLFIAGAGLAEGYWEDPEKTKAAFIPEYGTSDGSLMYRTGDLARMGADGLVHFVGRADTQIKSRGHRIELGEIEASLATIDGLKESAVVAVDEGGFEGAVICCAYTLTDGTAMSSREIRMLLAKRLPPYMLPARWAALDVLPKNANGKIDKRFLRENVFTQTDAPAAAKVSAAMS
jgi:amino acid adenylation domain